MKTDGWRKNWTPLGRQKTGRPQRTWAQRVEELIISRQLGQWRDMVIEDDCLNGRKKKERYNEVANWLQDMTDT